MLQLTENTKPAPIMPSQCALWESWWGGISEKFKKTDKTPCHLWAHQNIQFNEPGNSEFFSLEGREYIIEPINTIQDWRINTTSFVFGSQTGKTSAIMVMAAWCLYFKNIVTFWVMSDMDTANDFSNGRWIPMLKASITNRLIKNDAALNTFKQKVGGSIVLFRGAFSTGKLSSFPCDVVICDETDKFPKEIKGETGAVNLAKQRTKDKANPKHILTSTPSTEDKPIWIEFLKGDQRRYFLPCPHCGKEVLLAWSPDYYTFPKTGCEAYVFWEKEAKVGGTWNYGRVEETTHVKCPFCENKIYEYQKKGMVSKGVWKPMNPNAAKNYRSYQLSSLYASSPSVSWGKLAVKFLQSLKSLEGPQDFINGDLAEPYVNQMTFDRTELLVSSAIKLKGVYYPILTVDVQEKAPYFWFVVRAWNDGGDSRLLDFGSFDTFEEMVAIQNKYNIPDIRVGIDCGYDAQKVYFECVKHGVLVKIKGSIKKRHFGWTPMRGDKETKFWRDKKTGLAMVYGFDLARMEHKLFEIYVLGFNADYMKDVLHRYRTQQTAEKWEVTEIVNDEYYSHLNAEVKRRIIKGNHPSYRWELITGNRANHLLDCENMNTVKAKSLGFGARILLKDKIK